MATRYQFDKPTSPRAGRTTTNVRCTSCGTILGHLDDITPHGEPLSNTYAVRHGRTRHIMLGRFADSRNAALALVELHAETTGCNDYAGE